jgi:hypothetical protein
MREEAGAVVAALDRPHRPVGGRDELTAGARRLLLHVALPDEVARHVLKQEAPLAVAEPLVGDAAAVRALALIVGEVVDHRLDAQLRLQGGALAPALERGEPPRLGVLVGLVLTQLLLRRRHLLFGPRTRRSSVSIACIAAVRLPSSSSTRVLSCSASVRQAQW